MKNKIKIANAGGFWGDDLNALKRQLEYGDLDYISIDYLAEITMSILQKQKSRNSKLGYVTDFIDQIDDVAELLKEKSVKLLVNAGGINPLQCGREVINILNKKNIKLKVAIVEGDNITDELDNMYPNSADFRNLETGADFENIKDKIQSANIYLGVLPLLKALENDADIIIAGRVTDTSITMAPMIYEFGWKLNDWDKLAAGLVAGHVIECGAQSTGGNYTDWHKIENWENFAYPIVEVFPDGTFYSTKHENTGGLVNIDTMREQILYEMGDPAFYISPDVVVDFSTIQLEEVEKNRVKVFGIKGAPSTKTFKVSMAYEDGYKAVSSIIISGGNAIEKAKVFENLFWKRLNIDFVKSNTEFVGFNSCHQNLVQQNTSNEVLLRFSVYDYDKAKISEFGKSVAPVILSGPQGVAVTSGRPRPQTVMTYWPALIPKDIISSNVKILDNSGNITESFEIGSLTGFEQDIDFKKSKKQESTTLNSNIEFDFAKEKTHKLKFVDMCIARSGDKGDTANIGLIARNNTVYQFIKEYISADFIKNMFSDFCKGKVIRFELDNLLALNFLLEESLDGGGTKSLMIDAQGKTYAAALLNQTIDVPKNVYESLVN